MGFFKKRGHNAAKGRKPEAAPLEYEVYVGRDGGMYIDPDEAFRSQRVQNYLKAMRSIGKKNEHGRTEQPE